MNKLYLCLLLFFLWGTHTATAADMTLIQSQLTLKQFAALETRLNEAQRLFERGELSEDELVEHYQAFYTLDEHQAAALQEWTSQYPESYAAHLARGIYWVYAGSNARGIEGIDQTSEEQFSQMKRLFSLGSAELETSLALTAKPLLSYYYLMIVSLAYGDQADSLALLDKSARIYPENYLVRSRYMLSLTPRWGGSHEQMARFLSKTQEQGVEQEVLNGLEALLHNEIGSTHEMHGKHSAAERAYQKALVLGRQARADFTLYWLQDAYQYLCVSRQAGEAYCS
ncbi:MAG: DUF4034 domain-containing protein [Pseudomonadota bacterium]